MLIATYALSTFSVEQKKERSFIRSIQQYMQTNWQHLDPLRLESHLNALTRFSESRQQRRVAGALMPAVRRATRDADLLLADLDTLRRAGCELLRLVRRSLRCALSALQIETLRQSMERYCQNLLQRLAKEEQELLPLARRVMSSDDWFALGSTLLSHDASGDKAPGQEIGQLATRRNGAVVAARIRQGSRAEISN
ncbi:MAG: hypothetical protein ACI83P_000799 [Janthinobacterium sp.]|jgi:hypothetical protein